MKIGKFLQIAILILLAGGIGPAYSAWWQWSRTAASNATADPSINWSEGQSPSSINDSARAMMARAAEYRDDISGALTTGGTSTAYTLTTNQGLASIPTDGQLIAFTPNVTNGVAPTLTADGGTIYAILTSPGVAVGAATLIAGTPYTAKFSLSNTAWILRDFYGNAFSVPLGAFLHSSLATPPNANFITPIGQCISTTTYATYWVALGSPASGGCPGGQFAVVDVRGRNLTPLDTLSASAANRLTNSGTGCGTAFTAMGASCANGTESKTLQTINLPPYTPSGSFSGSPFLRSNGAVITAGATVGGTLDGVQPGTGTLAQPTWTGAAQGGTSTPMPSVAPNLGVYVFLRVL